MTRLLDEFVADDGDLDLAELRGALTDGPVELGVLSDEELHWFGPDPDGTPDAQVDAPRLGRLDPSAQQAALTAALVMLRGREELVVEPDGTVGRFGPRAFAVTLRSTAIARCTFVAEHAGERTTAALFRLPDGTFLLDEHTTAGAHRLTLSSADDLVGWLVDHLDPGGSAREDGEVSRADDPDRLDPPVSALVATANARADLAYGVRYGNGAGLVRTASTFATPDGFRVLRSFVGPDSSEHTLVALAPDGIARFIAQFLASDPAPGDAPIA
jgi:hypothetical protein